MTKRRSRRRAPTVCTYCGRLNPTSVDHVPPRSLFAKPRPSNLVTVPSCEPCNIGASQDDEYFRLTIALRHDLDDPDADAAMDAAVRSLSRPGGARSVGRPDEVESRGRAAHLSGPHRWPN